MANRIKGLTVEIGGDTTKLQDALNGVDSQIRTTQSNLRDMNKLLKLDPGNTDLLTQKHRALSDAIGGVTDDFVISPSVEIGKMQSAMTGASAGTNVSNSTENTYTINVYGSEGQSVSELADIVMDRITNKTARKGAAFA